MTTNQPLSLFISSKMAELADERRAVQAALTTYRMYGWLWEDDAGARPEPIRSTYLKEVAACDIYLGLFWLGYGPYAIEEYEHARKHNKPCLVYEKYVSVEQRTPELAAFLQGIQRVESPDGLTVRRFQTAEELAGHVQEDVMRLLTTRFRESRQQPVWNVPYRRNPFFSGREPLLKQLRDNLTRTKAAALTQAQAISGLGGIGKTQTAVEYAYRYRDEYQAVLWVNAATRDTLIASCVEVASLLDLPEKQEQDQNKLVVAVRRWLDQHDRWLLIFDNADDLELADAFLPTGGTGHILLTTRAQAAGMIANSLEVEKMDRQEGTLLLLRRARVLATDASLEQAPAKERTAAEAIVKEMDGLPLALDQAGAYIEETRCGVAAYLDRYRQQPTLLKRRGGSGKDHPEPVATTWSLSFEQVERRDPVAADLLRFCAFLAPDAIPEELIRESAAELGAHLQRLAGDASLLDEAIGTLLRFSLLRREPEGHTISMHRLVQVVLKAGIDDQVQRQWAERTVRAVNQAFPEVEFATWPHCQRLIAHAQACADLIGQQNVTFVEAARLLNRAGWYLREHAQYSQAKPLLQQALSIYENIRSAEASEIGSPLNNLGILYQSQGKYAQAEPLYQRALAIREQESGPTHPDTAPSLNNLAELYRRQGKYAQAEPLYQRALAIREQELGATHPDTAQSLNNLAMLYQDQGKYAQAEPLYRRALAIREQELGATHPDTANSLNDLAGLYRSQGKYAQAEPLYQRALAIREQELGPTHPDTAGSLNNLALLYQSQGKYTQAEPLYQRALGIFENLLGPDHPSTRTVQENYHMLLAEMKQGRKG